MFLQSTGYPADCSPGTNSGYKNGHFTVCIPPNFFTRCPFMNSSIGRILKLLQNHRTGNTITQLLRFGNGSCHPSQPICQYNLRTQRFQQIPPFQTHRFGHGQYQVIPFNSSHHCQPYTCISACRLNNRCTGFQCSTSFRIFNHRKSDSVFYTSRRIKSLQFGNNILFQTILSTITGKFHQRGIPH